MITIENTCCTFNDDNKANLPDSTGDTQHQYPRTYVKMKDQTIETVIKKKEVCSLEYKLLKTIAVWRGEVT